MLLHLQNKSVFSVGCENALKSIRLPCMSKNYAEMAPSALKWERDLYCVKRLGWIGNILQVWGPGTLLDTLLTHRNSTILQFCSEREGAGDDVKVKLSIYCSSPIISILYWLTEKCCCLEWVSFKRSQLRLFRQLMKTPVRGFRGHIQLRGDPRGRPRAHWGLHCSSGLGMD